MVKNRIAARLYRYEAVSFDRPELSPILRAIEAGSPAYEEALGIIRRGAERLAKKPRADMDGYEFSADAKSKNRRWEALQRLESLARKAMKAGRASATPRRSKGKPPPNKKPRAAETAKAIL